jgi:(p)ppGpp synthase/HD superfamily hydrolase
VPTLEDAILLAAQAHRGQRDKAGRPYILHPLRVMLALEGEDERIVGVLHDLVEDTGHTLDELLAAGYSEAVLAALDCLTRRDGETYEQFVERIKPNPIARRVKLADLADNLDVRRLPAVGERDAERLNRYLKAWAELRGAD